ncbi:MAG TPA: iron ABC transporter permease [Pelagibacterium sp.]|uniref:FecCD family ABC transporter permease n=1 Tax=Pelagibacterium sp. TaxID=1967288 RepID=UPI002D1994F3|nr:iron ABC transporter permease [Pelagibacterium sp.]HWJ87699.1 iron ABC transporter permease [Pelagibacterium sp.]
MLLASLFASISVGAAGIDLVTVWLAVFRFDPAQTNHLVIQEFRLPRVVASAAVGASLGVAGAIMQGMTRNPLASPSLMGLNAGAGLLLVLGLVLFPWLDFTGLILLSFLGAGLGVGLVFGIGALQPGGLTPVRLVLAGAAVSALFGGLTTGVVLYTGIAQDVLFYTAGGVQGVRWPQLLLALPWMGIGLLLALALARGISLLSLGEEVSIGLGQRTALVRAGGVIATLLLAGSAVAVAGGVGFVGLVVPHLARFLVGLDYRWIIPCSVLLGATLLVLADLGARMVNPPFETPVGLITALIGVPFFLWLARRDQRGM